MKITISKLKIDVFILIISNLLIGFIDFIFNIYCSKILGPEGMGLLSMVSPINCIFMSFITEGVIVTLSKIISHLKYHQRQSEMLATVKITAIANFLWGLLLSVILFFSAKRISIHFLGDISLSYPIMASCPLILLMSISNILKGYFLGINKIKVPAFINIAEKLFRYPVFYTLIVLLLNKTNFPSITIVYICYSIGEMLSVILLWIYYLKLKPVSVEYSINLDETRKTLKKLVKGAVPLCLTNCLLDFTNALSSILVKSRLMHIGYSYYESIGFLGKYKGMVFPIMYYPMIIIGSITSVIIPRMSTIISLGNEAYAKLLIKKVLYISLLIGIITMILYCTFAEEIGFFLYKRTDLNYMIKLTGLLSPLLYTSSSSSSILISMGKERISFRNSFLQQGTLLIGLFIFTSIPAINIYGYVLALFLSNAVLLSLNLIEIRRFQIKKIQY